jgi:SAM-dependent methyltransferase
MTKLNLGCGFRPLEGFINIDIEPRYNPDLVLNLEDCVLPFADNSVSEIQCIHVLEHLRNWEEVLLECWRVMAVGAEIVIRVPSFPSVIAISGIRHIRYFVPDSFVYFCDPRLTQPSLEVSDYIGRFNCKDGIRMLTMPDNEWMFGLPKSAEIALTLEKVTKDFWLERNAHRNTAVDVRVCFYCQVLLNSSVCPECGLEYSKGPEGVQE